MENNIRQVHRANIRAENHFSGKVRLASLLANRKRLGSDVGRFSVDSEFEIINSPDPPEHKHAWEYLYIHTSEADCY